MITPRSITNAPQFVSKLILVKELGTKSTEEKATLF